MTDPHRGAGLCAATVAVVVGSNGVVLRPWAVLLTLTILGVLVFFGLCRGLRWSSQLTWIVGLLIWVSLAGVVRPVSPRAAAAAAAVVAVALLLTLVAQDPPVRAGAHPAVGCAALVTAIWLVVERLIAHHRPGGPFANPNLGATVALLGLAVTPWLRVGKRTRAVLAAMLVAGILASGSRAALLGALGVATAWSLSQGGRRFRAGVALVVAVAATGLAARVVGDDDPLRFERVRLWGVALRTVVAEFPLGTGPGGYVDAALPHNFPRRGEFALYYRVPSAAECDLLQLAATLGLPGLILGGGLTIVSLGRLLRSGPLGWGVASAALVTSTFHSQLAFSAVAWLTTLAVVGCGRPAQGRRLRMSRASAAALTISVAASAAVALGVEGGGPVDLAAPATAARLLTPRTLADDAALADVEAALWQDCAARPRFANAWRLLGAVRLQRAELRRDPVLVTAAAEAFAAARRSNPLDVWAAVGTGQANRVMGQLDDAEESFLTATAIEPNCVQAWLELGRLHLERGQLDAAAVALRRVESAIDRASRARFITNYERALASGDPALLARLRAAEGGG